MKPPLLILNAGSSSLKFAVFQETAAGFQSVLAGTFSRLGQPESELRIKSTQAAAATARSVSTGDHASCLDVILGELKRVTGLTKITAVGHRVVHGGPKFSDPLRITPDLIRALRGLSSFDPEHLPAEIGLMEHVARRFPQTPQIACFDTAFHHALPRLAQLLPLPRRYAEAGVRRYGFHGLSYEFLLRELARLGDAAATRGRVILAHLGSGASLAAVHDGRCIDTSMGFTPTAGLMMGTRTGDLDPGLVAYLAQTEKMSAAQFSRLVNHESGLRGISETTADMGALLTLETTDIRAAEAIALFCYQAKKWLGAYTAALGGLDTLVFSGGIGENCPTVRARICEGLGFLGVELDPAENATNAAVISVPASRVAVRVIATDEELMIAEHMRSVLSADAVAANSL